MTNLVIDTSVVIAATRSRRGASARFMELVDTRQFEFSLSVALALEYESVLKRDEMHGIITIQEATELVAFLCSRARRVEIPVRLRPLVSDPGDDLVAELAILSKSNFVITHNLRHLGVLAGYGISVVTPGRFLQILREQP
jgi:putative PIN family toxin of toxin-antitoxin system